MTAELLPHDDVLAASASAPTLLFLHAFPFDRRMWRGQLASLSSVARVVAVDLRGFGAASALPREASPPGPSIDAMAADVERTIDELRLARPIVVGLSMGGYVALALARRAQGKLGGLVLCDTRAGADSDAAKQGRAANIERAREGGGAAVFAAMRANLFAKHASSDAIDFMASLAADQRAEGVIAALSAMRDRPDATPWLASIALPTVAIVGAEDALTPPSEATLLADGIPGARRVVIEGAGHLTNVENASAFDAALREVARAAG
jgi:pimeloyl-ACP methyl ester carboxylesterase